MSMTTIHFEFRKEGKSHSEVYLTDVLDFFIISWFLISELPTREAEYEKIIMGVSIPKGFEFLELADESTPRCGVDYKKYLSTIF